MKASRLTSYAAALAFLLLGKSRVLSDNCHSRKRSASGILLKDKTDSGQVYPPQAAPQATRAGMTGLPTYVAFFIISVLLIGAISSSPALAAPNVSATDRDSLQIDDNSDGQVNRGETVRHTITIRNTGDADASGLTFSETLDPDTTLTGSFRTTPVAINDAYSVNEDETLTIAAPGVRTNDIDPDGDALTVIKVTDPTHGILSLNLDGSFTYSPNPNYHGSDSFTYKVNDSASDSQSATVTLTVNSVNDVPSFTKGADQTVDEDSGAKTIESWATGISSGPSDESGQILTFNLSNDNNALFLTQPAVSSNGTLTYTPAVNAYGVATVTVTLQDDGGTANGGIDTSDPQTFTITVNPVNDAPVAQAKVHITHSGIGLTIDGASHTGKLKENATDADNLLSELTVTIVGGSLTPSNATLTLLSAEDGSFYFEPPGGVSGNGSASFQFRVCDNGNTALSLAPKCSNAVTATFNITGPDLWFVDDTDAAGCGATCNGSRTKPLVGLNNASLAGRGTGDKIFTFSGTYNHGHTFAASEQLISQASSGSFDTVLGISVPSNGTMDMRPTLTNGAAGTAVILQNAVTAASNTLMRGITIASTANGYVASGASNLAVSESSVTASQKAIDLTNSGAGASEVTFTQTNSSGGTHGISLQNVTGTLKFGSGTLSGNTTAAFYLQNANGSTITYGGAMSPAGTGRAVLIGTADGNSGVNASNGLEAGANVTLSGNITTGGVAVYESTGGSLTLSGSTHTWNTGTTRGVDLIDNNNATINFSGGNLNITTSTGTGFHASQGGIVNVTGTNNTINSTNGQAFESLGTSGEHMSGGYAFKSISSTNGAKGISLQYYDGGFTVSGDGAVAGSGGTIQTKTQRGAEFINVPTVSLSWMNFTNTGTTNGADPNNAAGTCGDLSVGSNTGCNAAIHLQSITTSATLSRLVLNGGLQQGVNGYAVNNLTLSNSEVKNFGDQTREDGLRARNLTGTANITSTLFDGNEANQARIENDSGTVNLTFTGCTFSNSAAPNGVDGLGVVSRSNANMTVNVQSSTFKNLRSDGLFSSAEGTSTINLTVNGSTFNTDSPFTTIGAAAVDIVKGDSANATFNVTNNTLRNNGSHVINIMKQPTATSGTFEGTISGNTIGTNGDEDSGTTAGSGIRMMSLGQGTLTAAVTNNNVYGITERGIEGNLQEDSSDNNRLNLTITNNTITTNYYNPSTLVYSMEGIYVNGGVTSIPANDAGDICAAISGNTVDTNAFASSGYRSIRVRQRFATTMQLPGYSGANSDTTAVANFIAGNNTTDNGVTAQYTATGGGFVGGAACETP